ncbi:MAG TPA: carbohydrate ABC transporter permease [Mycobacteriales bacterium]|nr:carbohydrate ABC transporter permease [Mycobacteriales bacterium]
MALSTEARPATGGVGAAPPAGPRRRRSASRPNWLAGALATLWLVIVGTPLYLMISWAVQRQDKFTDNGPLAPPTHPTGFNFTYVLDQGFSTNLLVTAQVTAASVVLTLLLALPAAFAIVRSRSWLAGSAFRIFLLGLAIPAQAVIIPVYLIIIKLQLYDTLLAIILPTVAFGLPLGILVLAGSLRDVTSEMYEAMAVDGATPLRMFVSLVLPLSRGSITAVGIYTGLNAWNGFIFPLVLTQSPNRRPVALALWNFQTEHGLNTPALMMAVLLSAVPPFVLYIFARRWLVAGLAGVGGR